MKTPTSSREMAEITTTKIHRCVVIYEDYSKYQDNGKERDEKYEDSMIGLVRDNLHGGFFDIHSTEKIYRQVRGFYPPFP